MHSSLGEITTIIKIKHTIKRNVKKNKKKKKKETLMYARKIFNFPYFL